MRARVITACFTAETTTLYSWLLCPKVKDEKPPAPTRGMSKAEMEEEEEEEDEDETDGGVNVADLVPRTDIR